MNQVGQVQELVICLANRVESIASQLARLEHVMEKDGLSVWLADGEQQAEHGLEPSGVAVAGSWPVLPAFPVPVKELETHFMQAAELRLDAVAGKVEAFLQQQESLKL